MKTLGLRRSTNKEASAAPGYSPQTLPTLSKPVSAVVPPKKVIRALASHRPTAPQELSFAKGDFFYVIRDVVHANGTITGARGLVPKELFEGFDKSNAAQRSIALGGPGARISGPSQPVDAARFSNPPTSPRQTPVFYAVVQHDFQAERPDELDAKAGDAISVVAHSNREWFVAKPIGRLGGPGLIPASFLEVRDPVTGQPITDIDALIDRGELPPVEEWKKATMNYKASSIALGVIDSPNAGPVPNSKFQQMAMTSPGAENRFTYDPTNPSNAYRPEDVNTFSDARQDYDTDQRDSLPPPDLSRLDLADPLPFGVLIRAEVSSFHYESNDWVFRVNATFRPDPPAKKNPFDPAPLMSRELTLFRVYDDFYVFQIQLLASFPVEAGRDPDRPDEAPPEDEDGPSTRILPYMPGPQDDVDETVTDTRRHDLDVYLKELVALREVGAEHILRCELVRKFFAARDGDIENEVPLPDEDYPPQDNTRGYYDHQPQDDYHTRSTQSQRQPSDYHDAQSRTTSSNTYSSRAPSTAETYHSKELGHPYAKAKAPTNPVRDSRDSGEGEVGYGRMSELDSGRGWTDSKYSQPHPYARESAASHQREPSIIKSPITRYNSSSYGSPKQHRDSSPLRSTYAQSNGRDSEYRSHTTTPSISTGNPNSPRISSNNHNAAFVKIKIFHSSTDELIAIRVSPRVSLRQLMEKVRERLGDDVANVKYRDGMAAGSGGTGHFVDILDDAHLREWMSSGDKLVLYAE
ncbi:SubName: Full=Related to Protein scd2/ral3 {ECO:0000313/EMBL:CCA74015.1} [Serendipita indica DSM 11827]|nr:SubName: Full=Related to Protein scd2/ral3 {ECO:0000313/EMBL:CCA74015.1} [Serendipita indica DSM 11827]